VLPYRVCAKIKVNSAAVDSEFPKNKQYNKMRGIIYSLSKHIGRGTGNSRSIVHFYICGAKRKSCIGLSVTTFELFFFSRR